MYARPSKDPFTYIDHRLQEMQHEMDRLRAIFSRQFEETTQHVAAQADQYRWWKSGALEENDNAVVLTLRDVSIDDPEKIIPSIENRNRLLIKVDGGAALLTTDKTVLSVVLSAHNIKEKQENEQEPLTYAQGAKKTTRMYKEQDVWRESFVHIFDGDINLENAKIDYKKESKILKITLPKEVKTKKHIAVSVS